MSTALVYIGPEKTGSTSVQLFLAAKKNTFNEYGWSWALTPGGEPSSSHGTSILAAALMAECSDTTTTWRNVVHGTADELRLAQSMSPAQIILHYKAHFAEIARSSQPKLILMSEIFGHPGSDQFGRQCSMVIARGLRDLLAPFNRTIAVAGYRTPLISIVHSEYMQRSKHTWTFAETFTTYLERMQLPASIQQLPLRHDQASRMVLWEEAGFDVHLISVEGVGAHDGMDQTDVIVCDQRLMNLPLCVSGRWPLQKSDHSNVSPSNLEDLTGVSAKWERLTLGTPCKSINRDDQNALSMLEMETILGRLNNSSKCCWDARSLERLLRERERPVLERRPPLYWNLSEWAHAPSLLYCQLCEEPLEQQLQKVLLNRGCGTAKAAGSNRLIAFDDRAHEARDPGGHAQPISNIVLVKVPKAASTTTSSVVRRVAAHQGLSNFRQHTWIDNEPGVWANHERFRELAPRVAALRQPFILVTAIRNPLTRAMSQFYHFEVLGRHVDPTLDNKLTFLSKMANFQFHYITHDYSATVDAALSNYALVGVTERMDEFCVQLADLFGISLTDVLSKSAKVHHHPQIQDEDVQIQDYLENSFTQNNTLDLQLWRQVSLQVDRRFGASKRLQKQLTRFRRLSTQAMTCCSSEGPQDPQFHWRSSLCYPNVQDLRCWCYWNDSGCDFACLNAFAVDPTNLSTCSHTPYSNYSEQSALIMS